MRDGTATRKKLERCALTLFVEKGVHATTIKDIAHKAKVAEGTMYRHWKSKDELAQSLFTASYEAIVLDLKNIISTTPHISQQIQNMVRYFCEKFDEDPILFRYLLLTQYYQIKYLTTDTNNAHYFIVQLITQAIHKHEVPKGDPHVYAAIALGILLQAAISRVYERITRKMSDDATLLADAILRAIQAKYEPQK